MIKIKSPARDGSEQIFKEHPTGNTAHPKITD
jgi:hypothetical protein